MDPIGLVTESLLVNISLNGLQKLRGPYQFTTLVILAIHGNVGQFKAHNWTITPATTNVVINVRKFTLLTCQCLVLPMLNAHLYEESGMGDGLQTLHLLTGIFPMVYGIFNGMDSDKTQEWIDLTTVGNVASMMFMEFYMNNIFYGSIAFTAFYTRFYAPQLAEKISFIDFDNITTLGYAVLAALTCNLNSTVLPGEFFMDVSKPAS